MEISFTCRTVPVLSLTFLGISEARSQFLLLPGQKGIKYSTLAYPPALAAIGVNKDNEK